jgi:hypothetical protein
MVDPMTGSSRPQSHTQSQLPPPPSFVGRVIRVILGVFVSAIVALAPFFGEVLVPGFTPLRRVIPNYPWDAFGSLQAFSGLLMATTFSLLMFFGYSQFGYAALRVWVVRVVVIIGIASAVLFIGQSFLVEEIHTPDEVLTTLRWFSYTPHCNCLPAQSLSSCIYPATGVGRETLTPEAIERCFGDTSLRVARLLLQVPYLTVMVGIAGLVGLLVIQQDARYTQQHPPQQPN